MPDTHPVSLKNSSVDAVFRMKWSVVLFVLVFVLSCTLRSDAAASVQIAASASRNYQRSIVRTATGNLYAIVGDNTPNTIHVYKSTDGGASWAQQDSSHAPTVSAWVPAAAIDGSGVIHIAYIASGLRYVTFSTASGTFSANTLVAGYSSGTPSTPMATIAVDSNNATHILYADRVKNHGTSWDTVMYVDNVGAGSAWNAKVAVFGAPNSTSAFVGDILVNQNNIPQVSYTHYVSSSNSTTVAAAAIGNANKATSFSSQDLASPVSGEQASIVLDSANNTWVGYLATQTGNGDIPGLIEHRASDPWSTWQPATLSGVPGIYSGTVGLAANGTTLYIAYPAGNQIPGNNVLWQSYNGTSWSTAATLDQSGLYPILKWSQWFNNGGSDQVDLLLSGMTISSGSIISFTGTYWNKITSTISSLSLSSGFPGSAVTISGSNFGSVQGNSTVTFNGVVATPSSWTSTSIVVNVPLAASSGPVIVTVGGAPSNPVNFTVLVPSISSLSTTSGPVGTSITISGANFGTSQGTSTVTFNGTIANPTSWSSSVIQTTVPAGASTGPVIVTVNGVSSNGIYFTVLSRPNIVSLSPNSGPIGNLVTISGSNFGATQGTSTIAFNGIYATTTSWSSTSIVAPVPSGATTGNVVVTVAALTQLAGPMFSLQQVRRHQARMWSPFQS